METKESQSISTREEFTSFVEEAGSRLRLALISRYGPHRGADATAEALAYAWEHWDRVQDMRNPIGYLFRVGQSKARRGIFRPAPPQDLSSGHLYQAPWFEPGLADAMESLSPRQRTAVVLVHGFDWTVTEVAELLGVGFSTAKRHIERGMYKLRSELGVELVG